MFEHDQFEAGKRRDAPAKPATPYEPVKGVRKLAYLVWAEHCIECAWPDCYSTCELYEPRPDHRCRRFEYGAAKNESFPSLRGHGTEVKFKKWGKLESRGNSRLFSKGSIKTMEAVTSLASRPAQWVGNAMYSLTGDWRWRSGYGQLLEKAQFYLNGRPAGEPPDGFLLEVYNPNDDAVTLRLDMHTSLHDRQRLTEAGQVPPAFQHRFTLEPGYSRHQVDRKLMAHVTEAGVDFDCSLLPEAEENVHLVFLTADFVKYEDAPATESSSAGDGRKIKCVVWDLDNTLWDGVLVEDGPVRLREGLDELLRRFDGVGILQSISSKNDQDAAWPVLEELGVAEYFLRPKINWLPKSRNIRRIAEELNIGLDTFAFIDDNPFELEEVRESCPEVLCLHVDEIDDLAHDPRFQGSGSSDAKNRRRYYKEAFEREEAAAQGFGDIREFLATCGIELEIAQYDETAHGERVHELVQRTNQLNYSGTKYSREELTGILEDPALSNYVLRCKDRFGEYGTIGFAVVRQGLERTDLLDFMLSCRVQGKFIEQAFLDHVAGSGERPIWVNYTQTARNTPARLSLEALGFEPSGSHDGAPDTGMYRTSAEGLDCEFIAVTAPAGPTSSAADR